MKICSSLKLVLQHSKNMLNTLLYSVKGKSVLQNLTRLHVYQKKILFNQTVKKIIKTGYIQIKSLILWYLIFDIRIRL